MRIVAGKIRSNPCKAFCPLLYAESAIYRRFPNLGLRNMSSAWRIGYHGLSSNGSIDFSLTTTASSLHSVKVDEILHLVHNTFARA